MWDQLPTNRRRLHLTKLMHAAEHVTLQISQNIQKNTQFDMNSTDLGKAWKGKVCFKAAAFTKSDSKDQFLTY